MGDLALIWSAGSADLAILENDLESDEGLRTACLLSLFTDRRAEEDDDLPGAADDLRGWWADEFLENVRDLMGSKLWLIERTKLVADLIARAQGYATEALLWLVTDGVAKSVTVEAKTVGAHLYYFIDIERPSGVRAEFKFAHVWEGEESNTEDYPIPAIVEPGTVSIERIRIDFLEFEITDELGFVWLLSDRYNSPNTYGNGPVLVRSVSWNGVPLLGSGATQYLIAADSGSGTQWTGSGHGNASTPANVVHTPGLDNALDVVVAESFDISFDIVLKNDMSGSPVDIATADWSMSLSNAGFTETVNIEALVGFDITTEYIAMLPMTGACHTDGGCDQMNEVVEASAGVGLGCSAATIYPTAADAKDLIGIARDHDVQFTVSAGATDSPVLMRARGPILTNTVKGYLTVPPRTVLAGDKWDNTTIYKAELPRLNQLDKIIDGDYLAAAMQFANAPTAMHKGDEATGATDLVGSADLTSSGAPTHEVSDSPLHVKTIEFTGGSSEKVVAAATSILDVGAESSAWLWVGRFTSKPVSNNGFLGNRQSTSPYPGVEAYITASGTMACLFSDGTTATTVSCSGDHYPDDNTPVIVLCVNDHVANNCQIWSSLNIATTGAPAVTGSMAGSGFYAYGRSRLLAAPQHLGLGACWIGSDAEGLNATHLTSLKNFLGI